MEPTKPASRKPYTLLFVDDEQSILKAIERITIDSDAHCVFFHSPLDALAYVRSEPVDVVVSDINMPKMNGIELLATIAEEFPEVIRLALSGLSEKETVMDAINQGRIWGFITKPWDNEQLLSSLDQAIYLRGLTLERLMLQRSVNQLSCLNHERFDDFVGDSFAMQCIYQLVSRAAPSKASVFITGQSGTGKELAAQAIHQRSERKDKDLITLNCAAIPSELLESEIFGHVKGAFSGAARDREGLASMADGSSLFLDEISEMDIALQSKLLRFIQTGTFSKVGSSQIHKVDIRFISACNRDPLEAISENKLREDLYYRLNVISIDMPPLKDREWDALLLANHFLQAFAAEENKVVLGFDQSCEALICAYHWPGNVRQLSNAVQSAVILGAEQLISAAELNNSLKLPEDKLTVLCRHSIASSSSRKNSVTELLYTTSQELNIDKAATNHITEDTAANYVAGARSPPEQSAEETNAVRHANSALLPRERFTGKTLSQIEREAVEQALNHCEQNVAQAAAILGVSPSTLYRKIQQWNEAIN